MSTRNIHIIGVGFESESIIDVLRSDLPCDKVYLLWNNDPRVIASKDRVVDALLSSGFRPEDVMEEEVDVFDYQMILNRVMRISQIEKEKAESSKTDLQFYLNISHSTRLVTGALCTATMILGAQMYYLKVRESGPEDRGINDMIIRVPTPRIPDMDKITDKRRRFLKLVCSEKDGLTVSELAAEFSSKQNVNQFVGFFENNNLVERIHEGRNVRIKATELGMMVANWLI